MNLPLANICAAMELMIELHLKSYARFNPMRNMICLPPPPRGQAPLEGGGTPESKPEEGYE